MARQMERVDWWRSDGVQVLRWQILCDCGQKLICSGFTNTCDCGADYNMSGQLLASRSQWGEETGETVNEILMVDDEYSDYDCYGDGGF